MTVKCYPSCRGVKKPLITVNMRRKVIANKCPKPRYNDTIMPEKQFPDVYADIPRHEDAIINKDTKPGRLYEGKKVKINCAIFAFERQNIPMKKIEMVDLRSQYDRLKPDIDRSISGVIDSTAFIKGPDVRLFEEELQRYLGVRNVIACANGTDALQIAMMALGLKPGDEVITTNFTFIATVEVIELLGLKLVLVEPEKNTFNISVEAIKKAITPRTKAIVPVHLFGQC
jgi:hypothetical protein